MTDPNSRSDLYPGMHGVIGDGDIKALTPTEQRNLRDDVESIISEAHDSDAFFVDILASVHRLRGFKWLDGQRTLKARRAEIKLALAALKQGDAIPQLSQIGQRDFVELRRRFPEIGEQDILRKMQAALPKVGSGKVPDDALVLAAAKLAEVYRDCMPRPPSSRQGGPFVALLEVVSTVAVGIPYSALQGVAEEALKIRPEIYSPGVVSFSRSNT